MNEYNRLPLMNLTIYRDQDNLMITRGVPRELGMERGAVYLDFIYSHTEIVVWTACELSEDERKTVSRGILDYLK